MQNRLEKYLNAVERSLRALPAVLREGEVREIEAHVRLLAEDYMASGHSEDKARALAIARFGRARRIGSKLRDTWEKNQSLALIFMPVVLGNWLFYFFSLCIYFQKFFDLWVNQAVGQALMPYLLAVGYAACSVGPALFNYSLSRWLGRHVITATFVANLLLFMLAFFKISAAVPFSGISVFLSLILFSVSLCAVLGAWAGAWQKSRQRFALLRHCLTYNEATALMSKPDARRPNWRPMAVTTLGLLLVGSGLYLSAKRTAEAVLYPTTPEDAVRVLLNAPGMNLNDMLPSTNVTTALLPPTTPREKAGQMRRVQYKATMHASEQFRQRRVTYLQRHLRLTKNTNEASSLRASIKLLQSTDYVIQGVARVVKSPEGWEWDTSEEIEPRAWLYEDDYDDQIKLLKEHPELKEPRN